MCWKQSGENLQSWCHFTHKKMEPLVWCQILLNWPEKRAPHIYTTTYKPIPQFDKHVFPWLSMLTNHLLANYPVWKESFIFNSTNECLFDSLFVTIYFDDVLHFRANSKMWYFLRSLTLRNNMSKNLIYLKVTLRDAWIHFFWMRGPEDSL